MPPAATRSISPATMIPFCRSANASEFAQKKGAGLFLSIHADYFPNKVDKATGATVYTLSEQASDDEARALAAKENFSDALAGIELPSDSDEVLANILIDLAQRETQNRSAVFARSIVGELASKSTLHTKTAEIGRISGAEGPGRALGVARAWIPEVTPTMRNSPDLRGVARSHRSRGDRSDRQLFYHPGRPQPRSDPLNCRRAETKKIFRRRQRFVAIIFARVATGTPGL